MGENIDISRQDDWKWTFRSSHVATELGEAPQRLLEHAQLIKKNPVRNVFFTGEYYIKLDKRSANHLRREWKCAELVEKRHLPVVEYMAIGVSSHGELIITRALKESVSVKDWLAKMICSDATRKEVLPYAEHYAKFVRMVIEARIFHPDFHVGNVLFIPATWEFVLVDVSEIRRAFFFDKMIHAWKMQGSVMSFQRLLEREDMLHLLELTGTNKPEKTWCKLLMESSKHLFHSWKKRSHQLLEGHPRYSLRDGNWMRMVDALGKPKTCRQRVTMTTSNIDDSTKFALADFFLQLANIPHQQLLAWNTKTGEIEKENCVMEPVDELPTDLLERLNTLNLRTSLTQWGRRADGKILLMDFTSVFERLHLDNSILNP